MNEIDIIREMLEVSVTIPTKDVFKHYMPRLSHLNRSTRVSISHFVGVTRINIAKEIEREICKNIIKSALPFPSA